MYAVCIHAMSIVITDAYASLKFCSDQSVEALFQEGQAFLERQIAMSAQFNKIVIHFTSAKHR